MATQNAIDLLEQALDRVSRIRIKGERPREIVYVGASLAEDIEDLKRWRELAPLTDGNPESVPVALPGGLLRLGKALFSPAGWEEVLEGALLWSRATRVIKRLEAATR